ncbi:MAG: alpha/beta fold hydrolase [Pyrinomonadaceae bacterium]
MSSMNTGLKSDAPSWLAFHKPNPRASLRLFCFHYAGGSAQVFREWHDLLPTVEVCPVQLPGRGTRIREGSVRRVAPLVEQLARELAPKLDVPFAFFGHSMGALIGFELARRLRRERGLEPAQLFLSGRRAPQLRDAGPPLHDLPDDEFIERLRDYKGTPEEVLRHPELMGLMLPFLRADFELCDTYAHQPDAPFDCPLTALGGLSDSGVRREDLEAWREHTTGTFSLRMFPGEHFFMNDSQPLLLQVLARELYRLT